MQLRKSLIVGVIAAVTIAACGGGDDATESTVAAPSGTTDSAADVGAGPTIPADVPEELLKGVGPMEVEGDALPQLPEGAVDDPAVGLTAPVIVAETIFGQPVRIDAAIDGPTWVVFLAHWCPHCNDEIPVIKELRATGQIPEGVNVVAVSTAVAPDRPNWPPVEWLEVTGWPYPAVLDGVDTAEGAYIGLIAFGVTGFPFSVLIDGDGTVAARWSGGRPADELVSLLTTNLTLS
jgi:cytochrome c biogenesis protein CcmG/thiol:disulfide interchange protein DsbE